MHEVSLVSALVDQVEEASKTHAFGHVVKLRVAIGTLSGIEPSCVEFCFSEVAKGSVLENAELAIETIEKGKDFRVIDLEVT